MKCYNTVTNMKMNAELKAILDKIRKERNFNPQKYIKEKAFILNDYMQNNGLDTCIVAVSGGIDSAVVLALSVKASYEINSPIKKIIPVLLPAMESSGVTNQNDATNRGIELCKCLGLKENVIYMDKIVQSIRDCVEPSIGKTDDWAIGQLVPYSRTPVLYYTASLLNVNGYKPIILGTTNLSEGGYLGYVGKASDGMVDVQMISDIYKSEVYKVSELLNIPSSIKNIIPAGDMYDNRVDEDVFGAPYDFVELYQLLISSFKKYFPLIYNLSDDAKKQYKEFSNNLEHLHKYNKHKYLCGSPAVHLDLKQVLIPNGWHNMPYKIEKDFSVESIFI